jgi:hypothetical protein
MMIARDPELSAFKALDFGAARTVEISTIKGPSKASEAFHGCARTSAWRSLSPAQAAEIGALVAAMIHDDLASAQPLKPGEERVWLHSFCFNPGYAVRLQTDRGRRDGLVCLECDEVELFDAWGHRWMHHLEKPMAARLAVLLGGISG